MIHTEWEHELNLLFLSDEPRYIYFFMRNTVYPELHRCCFVPFTFSELGCYTQNGSLWGKGKEASTLQIVKRHRCIHNFGATIVLIIRRRRRNWKFSLITIKDCTFLWKPFYVLNPRNWETYQRIIVLAWERRKVSTR